MTCLLSKYPAKYVKKILQKLQFFYPCKISAGCSLISRKKTAIIIFAMMAVTYSILSYLIFISENDF